MSKKRMPTRKENIAYWGRYLKNAGPVEALARLLETNIFESKEEADGWSFGSGYDCLGVTLVQAAKSDATHLLAKYDPQTPLADAILECHTFVLAAAMGEAALRNYLRHLLIHLFDWSGELDGMIDILIAIHNRRKRMIFRWDGKALDSLCDAVPPNVKSLSHVSNSSGEGLNFPK